MVRMLIAACCFLDEECGWWWRAGGSRSEISSINIGTTYLLLRTSEVRTCIGCPSTMDVLLVLYQWQYDSVSAIQLSAIGADLPQAVWPVLEATWKGAKLPVY
jgi:hypothetical protein